MPAKGRIQVRKIIKRLLYILIAAALCGVSGCEMPGDTEMESMFASLSPAANRDTVPASQPAATPAPETMDDDNAAGEPTADADEEPADPEPSATPSPTPLPSPSPSPSPTPSASPSPSPDDEREETGGAPIEMPAETILPAGIYGSAYLEDGRLSDQPLSWYFSKNNDHQPPAGPRDFDIRLFGGHYLGDTGKRVVYLTFDEGYENGYTGPILDTLKALNVPAAFFLTQTYIRANPDLVQRMVDEGHVAANHSVTHRSIPELTDAEIMEELNGCADYFFETTGALMDMFFRPPEGNYSARSLSAVYDLGYRTVFWSFAYVDWDINDQPGREAAYETIMNGVHNGAVLLLHAVSVSNAEALPDVIADLKDMGFEFGSLYDL